MDIADALHILGLSSNATQEDIKRAFHKLAHQHHPDKGGNAETFKKVSEARAVLKDYVPVADAAPFTYTRPAGFGFKTYQPHRAPAADYTVFNSSFFNAMADEMQRKQVELDKAMQDIIDQQNISTRKRFEAWQKMMKEMGM